MAVVKMKKAFLIGHNSIRDEVVNSLHERGLLHLDNLRERIEETELRELLSEYKPKLKDLNLLIDRVEFVLEFLKSFEDDKKGFVASMMKDKVKINRSRFNTIENKIDFNEVYNKAEEMEAQLSRIRNRLTFLSNTKDNLEPWKSLKLKLSEIVDTKFVKITLGQVPINVLEELQLELAEAIPESYTEVIGQDSKTAYLLLFFHKDVEDETNRTLYQYGFHNVSFPGLAGTPEEEITKIEEEHAELEKEKQEVTDEVKGMLFLKPDVMVLLDYLENKKDKAEAQVNFAGTREAFMLEGWVEADRVDELENKVNGISDEIELTVTELEKGEEPPIILKNKSILQPFEVLTRLYGLPNYYELDPTPLLAPFFFLFFGLCLGDFGYGLVLTLFCWFAARKWKDQYGISENTQRFLMLFAYGGIASMIIGVITGGYFGIETKSLPVFLQKLIIINPLEQASLFLGITCILGIIQVVFGILVEIFDCIRNHNIKDAVFTNLSTLLFLLAAIFWLGCWLSQTVMTTVPAVIKEIYPMSVYCLVATALFLIFAQGNWLEYYGEQVAEAIRSFKEKKSQEVFRLSLRVVYGTIFLLSVISWVATIVGFKGIPFSILGIVILLGIFLKATRPIVTKFLGGLYGLYGMSAFLGDILSYSRLMALGLATVLIAFVVNIMIKMVFTWPETITVTSIIIALICFIFAVTIAIVGHIFNLLINLIGAFVHPLRLQYVEFFPKFYEDGGKKFEPFCLKTKYLFFNE